MPEHTPSPTPARSIYGFVWFLAFRTLLVVYLCWALIPERWLNFFNIYYYPQKYWAVAIPIQFLVALTMFAFFIYPGLNFSMTVNINDIRTIIDNVDIKTKSVTQNLKKEQEPQCNCSDSEKCHFRKNLNIPIFPETASIPAAEDMDIRDVSRRLYLK